MREGLADATVFMTSRPIRFIRQVIGNGQLGSVRSSFMASVCPDILPGIIRGGWSNTSFIKHHLKIHEPSMCYEYSH